jgi:hypothetical protein
MNFMKFCGFAALCAALAVVLPLATPVSTASAAPVPGTAFVFPDIINSADGTYYSGLTDAGQGSRLMFDRRIYAFATYNAFLFDAAFSDGFNVEVQVNDEFGDVDTARNVAAFYAGVIGRLPGLLRQDVQTLWIHMGDEDFGGGNNNLLIHTDRGAQYDAAGFLEEVFVDEAAHTSLDADHASAQGWLDAQAADSDFISDYAAAFPTQEDIAESFLAWLALRYRGERITDVAASLIEATIPNRLAYFDAQNFDVEFASAVPAPGGLVVLAALPLLFRCRRR